MIVLWFMLEGLETYLFPITLWTITMCPKLSVMIVLTYEPMFYVTMVLEPSYRSHYLSWVDQAP